MHGQTTLKSPTVVSCRSRSLTFRTLRSSCCCCKRLAIRAFETSFLMDPYCSELQLCFCGRCHRLLQTRTDKWTAIISVERSVLWGLETLTGCLRYLTLNFRPQSVLTCAVPLYIYVHELFPLTRKCTNERVMGRSVSASSCVSIYFYYMSVWIRRMFAVCWHVPFPCTCMFMSYFHWHTSAQMNA